MAANLVWHGVAQCEIKLKQIRCDAARNLTQIPPITARYDSA
ncbi:hypothetical protein CAMGR0001_0814 [Campylobacter gracilis RM3268]|uniref:Uncharacterized protein n=1 Tax=Campylobacter gracilis RM3268 TaxID=553220 RepID=C8PG21_9BACT|nr:hypothetical protein CAMGR0001_0814 [Campylobacter gracilis RM3268]